MKKFTIEIEIDDDETFVKDNDSELTMEENIQEMVDCLLYIDCITVKEK